MVPVPTICQALTLYCSLERYVFFVYYLIMTAFWIDKPYILFIVEKNLRMPIFIIFQYKYIP